MTKALIWGSPQWFTAAGALAGLARWSCSGATYAHRDGPPSGSPPRRSRPSGSPRCCCAWSSRCSPAPSRGAGANAFVILADNSQSMLIRDGQQEPDPRRVAPRSAGQGIPVEDPAASRTSTSAPMPSTRTSARSMASSTLTFDGVGSSLTTALQSLSKRFRGLPIAGVLVFTDGSRTDTGDLDWSQLPPIYPVVPPARGVAQGHRRPRRLDQPDQLRGGAGRGPRRRLGDRLPRAIDRGRHHGRGGQRRRAAGSRRHPGRSSRSGIPLPVPPGEEGPRLLSRPRLRPRRGAAAG